MCSSVASGCRSRVVALCAGAGDLHAAPNAAARTSTLAALDANPLASRPADLVFPQHHRARLR
jgi:hypothetical protein